MCTCVCVQIYAVHAGFWDQQKGLIFICSPFFFETRFFTEHGTCWVCSTSGPQVAGFLLLYLLCTGSTSCVLPTTHVLHGFWVLRFSCLCSSVGLMELAPEVSVVVTFWYKCASTPSQVSFRLLTSMGWSCLSLCLFPFMLKLTSLSQVASFFSQNFTDPSVNMARFSVLVTCPCYSYRVYSGIWTKLVVGDVTILFLYSFLAFSPMLMGASFWWWVIRDLSLPNSFFLIFPRPLVILLTGEFTLHLPVLLSRCWAPGLWIFGSFNCLYLLQLHLQECPLLCINGDSAFLFSGVALYPYSHLEGFIGGFGKLSKIQLLFSFGLFF